MEVKGRPTIGGQKLRLRSLSSLDLTGGLSKQVSGYSMSRLPSVKNTLNSSQSLLKFVRRKSFIVFCKSRKTVCGYTSMESNQSLSVTNESFEVFPKPRKSYNETEEALDALEKNTQPRRKRQSLCITRAPELDFQERNLPSPPSTPPAKPALRSLKALNPARKVYINLPMLPFGRHSNYNGEGNLRAKLVSRKQAAWQRYQASKKPRYISREVSELFEDLEAL